MLLSSRLSRPLVLALGSLSLAACPQPNMIGVVPDGGAGSDASDPRADAAPDGARDLSPPADAGGDTSAAPADAAPECTPKALGCSDDGRSTRVCTDQGRWMVAATCAASSVCSAGLCLCSGSCADIDPVVQLSTAGFVDDLVGGGSVLHLAVNGPQASIRRVDIPGKKEMVVASEPGIALFALDSDAMGTLTWCNDVLVGASHTGRVVSGAQQLETAACTHVRRHDGAVYFKGDLLYRKTLDAAPRQTVTTEPMQLFEIAGNYLYFTAKPNQDVVLKRLSLAEPTKVETLAVHKNTTVPQLMLDASHVYLVSEGKILRVPQAANAQPEVFWEDPAADAWAMAQTDSHVYWSTTAAAGATECGEAQVFRRAKAGGTATPLSRTPGHCGGQLVRLGEQIYTTVWVSPPSVVPTKILRIRL